MASSLITSWEIEGGRVETVMCFSLGSKITVDSEIKKLAPWKESYGISRQCI